jgi:hypothetical protein
MLRFQVPIDRPISVILLEFYLRGSFLGVENGGGRGDGQPVSVWRGPLDLGGAGRRPCGRRPVGGGSDREVTFHSSHQQDSTFNGASIYRSIRL